MKVEKFLETEVGLGKEIKNTGKELRRELSKVSALSVQGPSFDRAM